MRSTLIDRLTTAALVLVPLAFGLFALSLGQDTNWDLRNYHWYNPHAFLTGRMSTDFGVAHHATFFNPLLDVPIYLLGTALPARAMGFVLGTVHGLNFVLVFWVANLLLAEAGSAVPAAGRRGIAALIALVGTIGGGHLGLVGVVFNDNIVSLLIFAAAVTVLRARAQLLAPSSAWPGRTEIVPLLAGGALIGIAVALKLPTAIFAVGFCFAFLFVGGALPRRFAQSFVFGLGVLAGFAIVGGPWTAMLWRDYGNPFFPFFNSVFQSPMGLVASYRDERFLTHSVSEALAFPFLFSADGKQVGEGPFRDLRIVVAYVVLIVTALLALWRRLRGARLGLAPGARYVIVACALSYAAWLSVFAIYRYAISLEMLAPLVTVIALAAWPMPLRLRQAAGVAVLVLVTATTQRPDWDHDPWRVGPFVTATPPAIADPGHTLALVTGFDPVGWLTTFFPPEIPFIRIQGYLADPSEAASGLTERPRAAIAAHRGPLYILFPNFERDGAIKALAAFGLVLDRDSCEPVKSNLGDHVHWCRVIRTDPANPA